MRTLEEILEGVTAGGRWKSQGGIISGVTIGFGKVEDAAYVARAARNFPALVRALNLMVSRFPSCDCKNCAEVRALARESMAEALKD